MVNQSTLKRRCVFLHRDGVINQKPLEGEYIRTWKEFRFLPGIAGWIQMFNALGLLVVVVTNQRGVARGLIREEDLEEIHSNMILELMQAGAHVDDVFCCPHEEGTCECRKPNPGMVMAAGKKWNIDIPGSVLIGDSDRDRKLAHRCGMSFVLVEEGKIVGTQPSVMI